MFRFPRAAAFATAIALAAGSGLAGKPASDPAFDLYLKPQTVAVLPDGRRLNFFCEGQGSPIAILDSG